MTEHSNGGRRHSSEHFYRPVDTSRSFPQLEEEILAWWKEHRIFEKSMELREGNPEWVFYEGPPTANGRPGAHHVLARVFKDIYPRYRSMRGYYVARKAGWDCHGLPVELEIEKRLGMSRKEEIEEYGIAEFNRLCRESVTEYVDDWKRMTERIGFWIDMDEAYWTMDDDYIESVWWILASLWKQGLLTRDHKIVPYCPRCGTALSSHEVSLGYEQVTDPSIFVRFPLLDDQGHPEEAHLLVWTTTPWTLISNTAVAVGADITYVQANLDDETFILAADLVDDVLGDEAEITATFPGTELVGRRYLPPFRFVEVDEDAWYILGADFVSTDEGTGLVHIAPAFGADDMAVGKEHGLPLINPVDEEGRFTEAVTPYAGMLVKQADDAIIRDLEEAELLFAHRLYEHSYPHCWRCDTPLIYYAKSAWYVRTTERKKTLIEANEEINWYPEHIKHGRFGDWLENNVDWSLSRERYWGTPLPLWTCPVGHERAVESRAELEELTGSDLSDLELHRPYVDEVGFSCPECGGEMRRVPEVIDAWFDSGSMPIGQWHYPFENEEVWKRRFPADFICEAIDQTRGWFYSLLAVSALLYGHSSYENVVCLGHILDPEGRKMSKRLGNVVDPWTILDEQGADALRWYLFTVSSPWYARRFSPYAINEVIRKFILTLWNTYSFYTLYANIDGFDPRAESVPEEERSLMDRWVLSELHQLIRRVDEGLDRYDAFSTGRAISDFVDELSNWYVRRSRRRFWKSESDTDKTAAYLTLFECLRTLARLLAPYMPFLAEDLYRNLEGDRYADAQESVHLCSWPAADERLIDEDLSFRVGVARRVVNLGRATRNSAQVKTRQPVQTVLVWAGEKEREAISSLEEVVREELNVKRIEFASDAETLVRHQVKPNYRALGPRFGKEMPAVAEAIGNLPPAETAGLVGAGQPVSVDVSGRTEELAPDDLLVEIEEREGYSVESDPDLIVGLSTSLSPELVREGLAREIVHHVQNARKAAGFRIEDRIYLCIRGDGEIDGVIAEYGDWIQKETLSLTLESGVEAGDGAAASGDQGSQGHDDSGGMPGVDEYREESRVNGIPVTIVIRRADES